MGKRQRLKESLLKSCTDQHTQISEAFSLGHKTSNFINWSSCYSLGLWRKIELVLLKRIRKGQTSSAVKRKQRLFHFDPFLSLFFPQNFAKLWLPAAHWSKIDFILLLDEITKREELAKGSARSNAARDIARVQLFHSHLLALFITIDLIHSKTSLKVI